MRGLSLVVASGGHSSSRCTGLSLSRPLLLRSTGSRRTGSVIVAHGLSCSAACGIFPDQGSNPCPLHWQADSQPLRHQGSPRLYFLEQFRVTEKLSGRCRDFPRYSLLPISVLHQIIFFIRDDPPLTHHYHPKCIVYVRVHCCCAFCGFS